MQIVMYRKAGQNLTEKKKLNKYKKGIRFLQHAIYIRKKQLKQ